MCIRDRQSTIALTVLLFNGDAAILFLIGTALAGPNGLGIAPGHARKRRGRWSLVTGCWSLTQHDWIAADVDCTAERRARAGAQDVVLGIAGAGRNREGTVGTTYNGARLTGVPDNQEFGPGRTLQAACPDEARRVRGARLGRAVVGCPSIKLLPRYGGGVRGQRLLAARLSANGHGLSLIHI